MVVIISDGQDMAQAQSGTLAWDSTAVSQDEQETVARQAATLERWKLEYLFLGTFLSLLAPGLYVYLRVRRSRGTPVLLGEVEGYALVDPVPVPYDPSRPGPGRAMDLATQGVQS